jgi:hypothetical protein
MALPHKLAVSGILLLAINLNLYPAAAKHFGRADLNLSKSGAIVAIFGLDRGPDQGGHMRLTLDAEAVDGGELLIWSDWIEGRPANQSFGGFRISIAQLMQNAKRLGAVAEHVNHDNHVSVSLVLSEREYDPTRSSKGVLKCVVRNDTDDVVHVPVGYDGKQVELLSGQLILQRAFPSRGDIRPRIANDVKPVRLQPGRDQLVFELALSEILLKEEESSRLWRWDWPRRPEPPRSPIHRWRKPGFNDQITLQAKVMVGKETVKSNAVELRVRATDSAK